MVEHQYLLNDAFELSTGKGICSQGFFLILLFLSKSTQTGEKIMHG